MARLRTYDPGIPCWVDVMCLDTAKAAVFYRELFGWEAVSQGRAEETGGYAIFQLDGTDVAGIGPGEPPGGPPTSASPTPTTRPCWRGSTGRP